MWWLLRSVAVLVQWAIYVPLWLLGSNRLMFLPIWGLWLTAVFIAINGGQEATTTALVFAMAGVVLLVLCLACFALTRNVWRPPGLTPPAGRQRTAKPARQPVWERAAVAVDAPSAETARARLAPRLQLLMKPPPSSPRAARP